MSQKRAESIKIELEKRKIESNRLKPVGKGESEPVYLESEINKMKFIDKYKFEKMHQTNRRTIIKIIHI